MHDIVTWFLVLGLFFPRLALLVAYLNGSIPSNNTPFFVDCLMAVLFPRFLILIYIGYNMGYQNFWFGAHCVMLFLAYTSEISKSKGGFWKTMVKVLLPSMQVTLASPTVTKSVNNPIPTPITTYKQATVKQIPVPKVLDF